MSDDDDDDDDGEDGEDTSFDSLFKSFTRQWQNAQLKHHVSLAGCNKFWKLSFKYVSKIIELKERENIKRKIPLFLQIRKNMYKDIAPNVKMNFAFLDKESQSIIHVSDDHTPLKEYDRNPRYQKLYEEAHIEVIIYIIFP